MAEKTGKVPRAQRPKTVTLKHKHAKPYRRRHVGILVLLIVAAIVVLTYMIQYTIRTIAGTASSTSFVSGLFNESKTSTVKLHSSYGFSLDVDQEKFYASAIDSTNGDLFLGNDLAKERAYSTVRISPSEADGRVTQSDFTLTYHKEISYPSGKAPQLEVVEDLALTDGIITKTAFTRSTSEQVTIGGQKFLKTTWLLKDTDSTFKIKSELQTYAGIVDGHPVTVVINYGLGASTSDDIYGSVLNSILFGESTQAYVQPTQEVALAQKTSRSLLDTLLLTQVAAAATDAPEIATSEKVAAQYSPAVVRIFNIYATDILVDNKFKITLSLSGGTGTGFIVSQDGYVATNGHVASLDVKGAVISNSLAQARKGQSQYFTYLVSLSGLNQSDIAGLSAEEQVGVIVDALYKIPDAKFQTQNLTQALLVTTTEKQPNINEIATKLKAHETYKSTDTIKTAKFVADNYRSVDGPIAGIDYFRKSDVALLKIEGNDYPITTLGDISLATQGANLLVMGYPAAANTELVDSSSATVSLTSSKVSAVKTLAHSNHKVIETDAAISPGNSGGPAFLETGEVVGLATYASTGNDSINYVRDIGDLKTLAKDSSITFDTASVTQTEWDKGLAYFYDAHYSKSLTNFDKVKALYPNHPKVAEFIAAAKTRIANGEDVQDFPILIVAIAAGVLLLGAGVTTVLIVRHKKKHTVYTAGVAQGTVAPIVSGAAPQVVTVEPPVIQAGAPAVYQPVTSTNPNPQQPTPPQQFPSQPVTPPSVDAPVQTPQADAPATPPKYPWDTPSNSDPTQQK